MLCLGLMSYEDVPVDPKDPTPTPPHLAKAPTATATFMPTPIPCAGAGASLHGWEGLANCSIRIYGHCWGIGCDDLRLETFIVPTKPNARRWFYQGAVSINKSDGPWVGSGHLGPNVTQCA